MKYIDADKLIAKIQPLYEEAKEWIYEHVLRLIAFLQHKQLEVDLNEEIRSWIEDNSVNGYYREDVYETAEHFFELGLRAHKGK